MANPNILLLRIDNRLVHGQVGVAWSSSLGANLLLVADDGVANDPLQQQIMSMTAESMGIGIRFFSLQKTIEIINKASAAQKIFIVCRTPHEARVLVEGGVPIKDVNVGNMHYVEGKQALSKKVYVDEQDLTDLRAIKAKGVEVFIQDTPSDGKSSIN
ncbi:TPA: PTS galactosamine transporter subunit IIB [Serratia fonticola]|uniref:PTS galactosamine transporter subunit IIB n=1 Tax=Serratia fonticola TaxID=47917 RepID=UPI000FB51614|nr:PTS galactosamine transporter subunit IIB [Serratia fonticola]CAI1847747.1 EIIAB-Man [Serratia fonticola]HBE9178329.1 PTS N-acetylgalactosamine transporter subunit IIB [Serratia fonticola]